MGNTGNTPILGFSPEYPNPPHFSVEGGVTICQLHTGLASTSCLIPLPKCGWNRGMGNLQQHPASAANVPREGYGTE